MVLARIRSLLVTMAVIAMLLCLVRSARASFPGKNGRIAFDEGPDIWTMNPDGSDERQLTSFGSSGAAACCQAWSADGEQLVFTGFASSTAPVQIWVMNADGSNRHQLLSDPSFHDTFPGFSPDGKHILFERCQLPSFGNCALYRVQADGSGLIALTHFHANPDVLDITAEYSPDGKTIAFAGFNRDGVISAIYLMNADGSNIRRITPPVLEAWLPDWSPDGTKITFSTRSLYPPNTITQQIWVINTDGRDLQQITFPGKSHDLWPSWSPQGNAMALERDSADFATFGIYVINLGGTGQSQMPTLQDPIRSASGSPSSHTGMIANRADKHHAKLVEGDGFLPRWGPAPK